MLKMNFLTRYHCCCILLFSDLISLLLHFISAMLELLHEEIALVKKQNESQTKDMIAQRDHKLQEVERAKYVVMVTTVHSSTC